MASDDCLENYETIEELGNGSVAIVRCKTWRFGARKIVLKKIPRSTKLSLAQLYRATLIHQSLYHPSVASLISAFTSPDFHYQILELCTGGSLSSLLDARSVVTEAELRSVTKGIIEALGYLKKEQVVHRNISPSAVLLTSEGRVKLSGFEFASRIPCQHLDLDISSVYVAPEILSQGNHDCTADLWSLGCTMITCLTGKPPISLNESTLRASLFTLRKDIPNASRNLVTSLIQINPDNRLPLQQILSHQFFDSSLPVVPLRPSLFYKAEERPPLDDSRGPNVRQPLVASGYTAPVVNTELRKLLSDELSGDPSRVVQRRIASDPFPKPTETLASELAELNYTAKTPVYPRSLSKGHAPLLSSGINLKKRPERSKSVSLTRTSETTTRVPSAASSQPGIPKFSQDSARHVKDQCTGTSIPVGTTRPIPLTTSLLNARAHKTVHGLITILPSRSLLVDFRECQRRNGEKGDQVLLIDPDGGKVKVYDAPHLSSPCCLAEPNAEYDIAELPSSYWKVYNDAAVLVDRIKQRTPKLVLYEAEMKCTLMANGPKGDIEILFLCPSNSAFLCERGNKPAGSKNQDNPRMRIRLFRQSRSIEIARSISGTQGKEWINRTLYTSGDGCSVAAGDWERLEDDERKGIQETARFVRLSEAHERSGSNVKTKVSCDEDSVDILQHAATRGMEVKQASMVTKVSSTPATKLSSPLVPSWNNLAFPECDSLWSDRAVGSGTFVDRVNPLSSSTSISVETRFIRNVGWCVRHNSRVTQGGRYKIMFLDGATFDVDVDEEWIEYTSPTGQTSRHCIRESQTREVAERMKVFEEFISLFEDDKDEIYTS